MDKGAHFYRCDFQVHTPRDLSWSGPDATTPEERNAYAQRFVAACRQKGLQGVAITDHHCMAFVPFIRRAAAAETAEDGTPLRDEEKLVVFPGMELTLGVPCQAIVVFDADFPDDMFQLAITALTIAQNPPDQAKTVQTTRLNHIQSMKQLKEELDKHSYLKDRYIVFPNVTNTGGSSLLRTGQHGKYIEMPWVGGYTDGSYASLRPGTKNILVGLEREWGNKRIACIQTSDSRSADHAKLGDHSTWIKWATPTAEALRQACLAQESRISLDPPRVPETFIAGVSIANSSFLGPVDLDFNPQYSALIGGRGTGKSSVLEYIRWALCDQPPAGDEDEVPNYQARRRRLIEGTLKPHNASVDVTYVLNGVVHRVRRSSADGAVQMKIASQEFRACTEEEVRALLPLQAYSQKQLSDVSVRIDELTRFITAPIKGELDLLKRNREDKTNRIRETYATRQRYRELSRTLHNRVLEESSIIAQAAALRGSLAGLTNEDRALLGQGQQYNAAGAVVASWKAGAVSLRQKATELLTLVHNQSAQAQPAPSEPVGLQQAMGAARAQYVEVLRSAMMALDGIITSTTRLDAGRDDEGPWTDYEHNATSFKALYAAALQRSSSHSEKLGQLTLLEERVAQLTTETTELRETLATLSNAGQLYETAREEWLAALTRQDDLVDGECAALTARSQNLIRVSVKRFGDPSSFVDGLRSAMQGSRMQATRFELLGEALTAAPDARALWIAVLADLEALADYDAAREPNATRPGGAALRSIGFNPGDIDRFAEHLTPEKWLVLSLTPIASVPVYEFRSREGEYIPFKNASAGQQATALLKTLLNQSGPPLIIDQPEEDLDNPVMLEIVEQLWSAKCLRQIIFASHNANLVVNGDAELVAWFDYRVAGDQSRGTVKGAGAIDVPEAREAIKQIMEGGEKAFELRREKYGF